MDGRSDRQTDGRTDGRTDGQTDGRVGTSIWTGGHMCGRTRNIFFKNRITKAFCVFNGYTGRADGRTGGRTDGRTHLFGRADICADGREI